MDEYNYGPLEHELAGGTFAEQSEPKREDAGDWLYKQIQLARLVPGLVKALRESATWFHATHRNIWGEDVRNCGHEQCIVAQTALSAVAKEE